jgi:hypothetical protein
MPPSDSVASLSPDEFERRARELGEDGGLGERDKAEVAAQLVDGLISTDEDWCDQALVDLLRGEYGAGARGAIVAAMAEGIEVFGMEHSFAWLCIHHRRLQTLSRVASLGPPPELPSSMLREEFPLATTDTGAWLDLLSNVSSQRATSFARLVSAYSMSDTGPVLADILVLHDPDHGLIEHLSPRGSAVVTQARMRRRIARDLAAQAALAASSDSPQTPEAPAEVPEEAPGEPEERPRMLAGAGRRRTVRL